MRFPNTVQKQSWLAGLLAIFFIGYLVPGCANDFQILQQTEEDRKQYNAAKKRANACATQNSWDSSIPACRVRYFLQQAEAAAQSGNEALALSNKVCYTACSTRAEEIANGGNPFDFTQAKKDCDLCCDNYSYCAAPKIKKSYKTSCACLDEETIPFDEQSATFFETAQQGLEEALTKCQEGKENKSQGKDITILSDGIKACRNLTEGVPIGEIAKETMGHSELTGFVDPCIMPYQQLKQCKVKKGKKKK